MSVAYKFLTYEACYDIHPCRGQGSIVWTKLQLKINVMPNIYASFILHFHVLSIKLVVPFTLRWVILEFYLMFNKEKAKGQLL